ncbi:MAG: hypothetical protein ACOX4Z_02040 [Desulfobulbus sp.]|jgi:hypothetical protein
MSSLMAALFDMAGAGLASIDLAVSAYPSSGDGTHIVEGKG